ncbi:XIAP-associated factor 1 isoform X2 [Pungitius pungitius]|uniref:XIAP-associated factor 1 isoform X2 n=1 Tax=Pungitius pungitius TaxID=134920 RepID=UPI002E15F20E
MEDKQATRSCGTCHKDVSEANFSLHETHCRRFLCLCPVCKEPVPRDQLDRHQEEQHAEVRCSKCHLKMERRHLADHQTDACAQRLQSCCFCELVLPLKHLDQHRVACGSRTELCADCGRYVTLRERPGHGAACSASEPPGASGATPPPKNKGQAGRRRCGRCSASFPPEEVEEHELVCFLATPLDDKEAEEERDDVTGQGDTDWWPRGGRAAGPDEGDPDLLSTCPHCHLALPLATLRWHQVKCQILRNLRNLNSSR